MASEGVSSEEATKLDVGGIPEGKNGAATEVLGPGDVGGPGSAGVT